MRLDEFLRSLPPGRQVTIPDLARQFQESENTVKVRIKECINTDGNFGYFDPTRGVFIRGEWDSLAASIQNLELGFIDWETVKNRDMFSNRDIDWGVIQGIEESFRSASVSEVLGIKKSTSGETDTILGQLELAFKLETINQKKSRLRSQLTELLKVIESAGFDEDLELREKTHVRLDAVKTLSRELNQEEEELRARVGEFFPNSILKGLEMAREKLKVLEVKAQKREIQPAVFEQLHAEYSAELSQFACLARQVITVSKDILKNIESGESPAPASTQEGRIRAERQFYEAIVSQFHHLLK